MQKSKQAEAKCVPRNKSLKLKESFFDEKLWCTDFCAYAQFIVQNDKGVRTIKKDLFGEMKRDAESCESMEGFDSR